MSIPRGGVDAPYHLIDGVDCTGTTHGYDFSNSNNDFGDTYLDKIILQNSATHTGQVGATNSRGILAYNPAEMVVRFNTWFNQEGPDIVLAGNRKNLSLYGNKFWRSATSNGTTFQMPGSGGYVRSNVVVDTRSSASGGPVNYDSGELSLFTAKGNQYYTPSFIVSSVVKPFYDVLTSVNKTFAEWQGLGFDQTGCYLDPQWNDPANGDLSM